MTLPRGAWRSRAAVGALYTVLAALRAVRNLMIAALGGKTVGVRMIVERDGQVCLIRHTYGDRAAWMLPGGGVDWRETPEQAAVRETREEAGIAAVGAVRIVWSYRHTLGGGDDIVVVFATTSGDDCAPASPEIAEARWFALDALPDTVTERTRRALIAAGLGTAGRESRTAPWSERDI